jgi:hypothetical protein
MKSSAQTIPLGPWPKGIQNMNDPTATPKGALIEAVNVLINSDGSIEPRRGYSLATAGGNSLFRWNSRTFGLLNNAVVEIFDTSAKTLGGPTIQGKVTWSVFNDRPMFTNMDGVGLVVGESVEMLTIPAPMAPTGATIPVADMYISFVNKYGNEGPLAPYFGSLPAFPTDIAGANLYRRQGDTIYRTNGQTDNVGRPAEILNLAGLPGGKYARYWRGRVIVARGRTLFFSEPFNYALYNRSAGFVQFESAITFIEAVEGGVYVGLKNNGVHFLAGATPEDWKRTVADLVEAQPGASLLVPTSQMKLTLQSKPEWVAVWFTDKGFAVGLPSGNVTYPQADLLGGLPLGIGSLHFEGDRLIVLSQ